MLQQDKVEDLTLNINKYINTNIELLKLEAIEKSSVIGSKLIANLIVLLISFLLILFASLGAGFYLSNKLGDTYSGFMIVAGFYLIIGLLLFLLKRSLLEKPFRDNIIYKICNKN